MSSVRSNTVSRLAISLCSLLLLLLIIVGCNQKSVLKNSIQVGQTRDEVLAAAGKPDEISTFVLPSTPFFGPQEALTNLLPAGEFVEEWRYQAGGEVTYVWFAGEADIPPENWTVIHVAAYPEDAVF